MQPERRDQTCSSVAEFVLIRAPGSRSQGSLCETASRRARWGRTEGLKAGAWREAVAPVPGAGFALPACGKGTALCQPRGSIRAPAAGQG